MPSNVKTPPSRCLPRAYRYLLPAAIALLTTACTQDTGADDDSGLSDGTGQYKDCPTCVGLSKTAYDCGCGEQTVCATNEASAEALCEDHCEGFPVFVMPCDEHDPVGSCVGWDPGAAITLSSGTYYVDAAWFNSTIGDPAPLWTCDSTNFTPVSGGNFKAQNVNSRDALYKLGLRTNDVLLSLNEMPLADYADVSLAFATLYVDEGESQFDLEVVRGSNVIHLYYSVYYT